MERTTLTRNLALLEAQNWITIQAGDDPRARMIAHHRAGARHRAPQLSLSGRRRRRMSAKLLGADGEAALKLLGSRNLG